MSYQRANPDGIEINDRDGQQIIKYYYRDSSCRPIPFATHSKTNELIVGEIGEGHSDLRYEYEDSLEDEGRIWNDTFITIWGATHYDEMRKDRMINLYKYYYNKFKNELNYDIGNLIILAEDLHSDDILAVRVSDFLRGKKPIPYLDFVEEENSVNIKPTGYEKFADPNDPDDCDFRRRQKADAWYGRIVAEDTSSKNSSYATPDCVWLIDDNGNEIACMHYYESNAYPFLWYEGNFIIGENGWTHKDLIDNYLKKEKSNDDEYGTNYTLSSRSWDPEREDGNGRVYKTSQFNYIVSWDYRTDNSDTRDYYKCVYQEFYKKGIDINDYVILFQEGANDPVYAERVKNYIRGHSPMELQEFLDFEDGNFAPRKSKYDNFSSPQDPNDDEHMRMQRYREWNGYGREVAESIKKNKNKNSMTINESQLKKMIAKSIKKAINEMDADRRSQLLRSFYSDAERRRMPKEKYPFKDNGKKSKYETEPVKQDKKK